VFKLIGHRRQIFKLILRTSSGNFRADLDIAELPILQSQLT